MCIYIYRWYAIQKSQNCTFVRSYMITLYECICHSYFLLLPAALFPIVNSMSAFIYICIVHYFFMKYIQNKNLSNTYKEVYIYSSIINSYFSLSFFCFHVCIFFFFMNLYITIYLYYTIDHISCYIIIKQLKE